MKIITNKIITNTILLTLFISQALIAAQTCEDYIADEWSDSRYTIQSISSDNIVTDNKTGLMWKKCSEGLSGTDCTTGALISNTWEEALAVPGNLNTTGFAGYSDWRLPNIVELRSIVALNCYIPSINETVFPNTPSHRFWSSSPMVGMAQNGWSVRFNDGYSNYTHRNYNMRVRLVRSGL